MARPVSASALERASGTEGLHLAWRAEHVAALLETSLPSEAILPLTTVAWRALAERVQNPPPALSLIDLKRDWRELEDGALAVAHEAMGHLAERREGSDAAVGEPALDRWQAYLWARQILHLQDVVAFTRTKFGPEAQFRLPHMQEPAGPLARMRWFIELALAGGTAPVPTPEGFYAPAPNVVRGELPVDPDRPGILVATFGLADLPGLITRLAKRREFLIFLVESESSHLGHLGTHWQEIAARPGGAMMLAPAEPLALSHRPPATDVAEAIAAALETRAWPPRRAVWRGVEQVFATRRIAEAHISDHACDGSMAILARTRKGNTLLNIESHSGLSMPAVFYLPFSEADRGRYTVWDRHRALGLRQEFARRNVPLCVKVVRPRNFGSAVSTLAETLWRHARAPKRPLRLGVLVTTGLDSFAADRAIEPLLSEFADFIEQSVPFGTHFEVRLRASEDDPRLFVDGLTPAAAESIAFHRVGDRSLRAMLSDLDAVIELGSPTSASLTALARGIPVFRLAAHAYQTTIEPGPALPVLPRTEAAAALQAEIGDPLRRAAEGLRQRMLLARRKRTGKARSE